MAEAAAANCAFSNAAEGRSYALGQDEDFKKSYNLKSSDTDKYVRDDIFDEQLTATAKRILLETRIQQIWRVSFPIFVGVLTIISIVLFLLDRTTPIYDGSTDTALKVIVHGLSFLGWSEKLTGNNFALISIASPLIGFLSKPVLALAGGEKAKQ
jgi:hypothetical protein